DDWIDGWPEAFRSSSKVTEANRAIGIGLVAQEVLTRSVPTTAGLENMSKSKGNAAGGDPAQATNCRQK
ncbi:MAG: hypothetical protein WCQ21_33630, partial [Verrucomicrobiota bacterium]